MSRAGLQPIWCGNMEPVNAVVAQKGSDVRPGQVRGNDRNQCWSIEDLNIDRSVQVILVRGPAGDDRAVRNIQEANETGRRRYAAVERGRAPRQFSCRRLKLCVNRM